MAAVDAEYCGNVGPVPAPLSTGNVVICADHGGALGRAFEADKLAMPSLPLPALYRPCAGFDGLMFSWGCGGRHVTGKNAAIALKERRGRVIGNRWSQELPASDGEQVGPCWCGASEMGKRPLELHVAFFPCVSLKLKEVVPHLTLLYTEPIFIAKTIDLIGLLRDYSLTSQAFDIIWPHPQDVCENFIGMLAKCRRWHPNTRL